ncbi:hypothetical protein LNQ81_10945 [Myroides sp. M-43]|uniref:hypothetical protein n=1 Tax=Myroides oncorhynchi TaxID=2893756 RepID=UPI001E5C6951|nr:hypothetical protein [Myroides oncorhynchi]MCC9043190.1 hypothetical protein [Myroides oncorhynchi]
MTKIKDGSVGASTPTAVSFSILELESTTKGFLLPRMTTEQRNSLTLKITDKVRGNGLAIYNTDDDCINYWSSLSNKWLSICGALPPATMELNCSKISLNATGQTELTQGRSLKDTDILYVSVNVTHTGSFSISAITENGYSFSKSGVFETTGVYTIALEGFGTPMADNINPGDVVSFSMNGKKNTTCTDFKIKVKSSAIDFEVLNATPISWKAYKGIALNAEINKIELEVKVNTAGFWRIQGDKTENGISLSGSGEFDQDQVGKNIKIYVYAQGSPRDVGINKFSFVTNSANNKTPNVTVDITVLAAAFELACDQVAEKFVPRGVFQEGSTLNRGNSITVPVKVVNPGLIDIEMTGSFTGSGSTAIVKFSAPGTFLSKAGEVQLITLYANSVKVPLNTTGITLTGITPGSVTFCNNFPIITVTERSKVYTVNCNYVSPLRMIRVNRALVAGQDGLNVSVDVGFADNYTIKTNELNGVSFEQSGVFTDADREKGTTEVILPGRGTPLEAGIFNFEITVIAKDGKVIQTCTVPISFVGPDITILALGTQAYAPTGRGDGYGTNAILNNSRLFGPNGIVKVNSIKVLTNNYIARFPSNLRSYLEANNVDIVLIGYPTTYGYDERVVLEDFIKRKKIVVIMADELNLRDNPSTSTIGSTNQLIADLAGSSYLPAYIGSAGTNSQYTLVNKVVGPNTDPIVSSEFGSMFNGYLGNDYNARISYFKNLPSDYVPIAVSTEDSSLVWIFRHKTLGFIFLGDGGIFAGNTTNNSNVIFPVKFDASGTLLSKSYLNYGKGGTYQVQNSLLYANTLKWAIEFILKNK